MGGNRAAKRRERQNELIRLFASLLKPGVTEIFDYDQCGSRGFGRDHGHNRDRRALALSYENYFFAILSRDLS
jgi:hypothetical protein